MKPMGACGSFIVSVIPAIMLTIATRWGVPWLSTVLGILPVVAWFICGGILVFLPMGLAALALAGREPAPFDPPSLVQRFRLQPPSVRVVAFSGAGLVATVALTAGVMAAGDRWIPGFSAQPDFMTMRPLSRGEFWVLAAWLPLFILNIGGEALFWRGYVFPRQELAFGRWTWCAHSLCWATFHIPFGAHLLLTLVPIIVITSMVVQVTRSTWADIIIHTAVNGSGFLLVALGVVR